MCHVVFLKERNAQSFEGCEKLVLVLTIVMLKTAYDWMVATVPFLIKIVMEVEGQSLATNQFVASFLQPTMWQLIRSSTCILIT